MTETEQEFKLIRTMNDRLTAHFKADDIESWVSVSIHRLTYQAPRISATHVKYTSIGKRISMIEVEYDEDWNGDKWSSFEEKCKGELII